MALKTAIENLNAARKKYDDELKKLGDDTSKAIGEFLGEHIPAGFSVEWTQYTPYFNDGDACTFSVHLPYLYRTPTDEDDDTSAEERDESLSLGSWSVERYGNSAESYPIAIIDGLSKEQLTALVAAWDELPEDMLEQAFGDHAEVVIRKAADGTVTTDRSEYSHD